MPATLPVQDLCDVGKSTLRSPTLPAQQPPASTSDVTKSISRAATPLVTSPRLGSAGTAEGRHYLSSVRSIRQLEGGTAVGSASFLDEQITPHLSGCAGRGSCQDTRRLKGAESASNTCALPGKEKPPVPTSLPGEKVVVESERVSVSQIVRRLSGASASVLQSRSALGRPDEPEVKPTTPRVSDTGRSTAPSSGKQRLLEDMSIHEIMDLLGSRRRGANQE